MEFIVELVPEDDCDVCNSPGAHCLRRDRINGLCHRHSAAVTKEVERQGRSNLITVIEPKVEGGE